MYASMLWAGVNASEEYSRTSLTYLVRVDWQHTLLQFPQRSHFAPISTTQSLRKKVVNGNLSKSNALQFAGSWHSTTVAS